MPTMPGRKSKPTIAVVTLHGPIVSGRGGPQVLPFGQLSAGGDTIAAALREAAADDAVVGVVLRVDSPGGSVTGSETIWREVNRVRDGGKPVVASMGAVAASGGYYVSMSADAIVANAGTITGSIGVITGKLVARELKDRLGVGLGLGAYQPQRRRVVDQPAVHRRATCTRRGRGRPVLHRLRRAGRAGRKLTVEAVDAIARGRVWTGADALEHGLVDELGGLRTAINAPRCWPGSSPTTTCGSSSYPGLVDYGLPAAQAVVAARRGVAAGRGGRAAGPFGGRRRSARPSGRSTGASALWLGDYRF